MDPEMPRSLSRRGKAAKAEMRRRRRQGGGGKEAEVQSPQRHRCRDEGAEAKEQRPRRGGISGGAEMEASRQSRHVRVV